MRRLLLAVAVLAAVSCGGSKSPTAPPPPPAADLRVSGNMTFSLCGQFSGCFFEGAAVNRAAGCAVNVRGVSKLFDSADIEKGRAEWALPTGRRINPGETFLYSGCCFSVSAVNTTVTYETQFAWDTVRC